MVHLCFFGGWQDTGPGACCKRLSTPILSQNMTPLGMLPGSFTLTRVNFAWLDKGLQKFRNCGSPS